MGKDNSDKEGWIGALGKAMIKTSVMMDNMDGVYMWSSHSYHNSLTKISQKENLNICKQ